MKKVIFHVGVGKSGTTSMQENIFNKLPNVLNLGRPNDSSITYRNFYDGILHGEDYELEHLIKPFKDLVYSSNEDVIVVSDENIQSDIDSITATRIANYFPDDYILITIRNQISAIMSHYSSTGRLLQFVPKPHVRHVDFDDYLDYHLPNSDRGFFRQIQYDRLVKSYLQIFGKEKQELYFLKT